MEMVRFPTMPEHVMHRVLFYERGSKVSRKGDTNREGGGRKIRERIGQGKRDRETH